MAFPSEAADGGPLPGEAASSPGAAYPAETDPGDYMPAGLFIDGGGGDFVLPDENDAGHAMDFTSLEDIRNGGRPGSE